MDRIRLIGLLGGLMLVVACGGADPVQRGVPSSTAIAAPTSIAASPVPSQPASAKTSDVPIDLADLHGTIAFSYDDGIWASNADGTDRRRLVRPDGTDDHRITDDAVEDCFPVWSPDGRYLMWSRHGELVVARPDGSGLIRIGSGNFPTWVP